MNNKCLSYTTFLCDAEFIVKIFSIHVTLPRSNLHMKITVAIKTLERSEVFDEWKKNRTKTQCSQHVMWSATLNRRNLMSFVIYFMILYLQNVNTCVM
jgi:hypothetical protein